MGQDIENCIGCTYYRKIGAHTNEKACHYFIDTGKLRGCKPQNCKFRIIISRKEKRNEAI